MQQQSPCELARDLMCESLSADWKSMPPMLHQHLQECPSCQKEWHELTQTLQIVQVIPMENPVPSNHLWQSIETRIGSLPQEQSPLPESLSLSPRNLLMAQYAYLLILGFSLCYTLTIGQPFFLQALQASGFPMNNWIIAEYGLFILFFSLGGFIAVLAAPILVQTGHSEAQAKSWFGKLMRVFSGNLRLFACY